MGGKYLAAPQLPSAGNNIIYNNNTILLPLLLKNILYTIVDNSSDGGGAMAEGAKGIMTKLHRGAYNNIMMYLPIIYVIINPLSKVLPEFE